MNPILIQVCLAIFGLTALTMAMGNNPVLRRWAPIVGLCSEVFWTLYVLDSKAWGIGLLVIAYTAAYAYGVWVQWRPQ